MHTLGVERPGAAVVVAGGAAHPGHVSTQVAYSRQVMFLERSGQRKEQAPGMSFVCQDAQCLWSQKVEQAAPVLDGGINQAPRHTGRARNVR